MTVSFFAIKAVIYLTLPDPATIDPNYHQSSKWIEAENKMDLWLIVLFVIAGILYVYINYFVVFKKEFTSFQRRENNGVLILTLIVFALVLLMNLGAGALILLLPFGELDLKLVFLLPLCAVLNHVLLHSGVYGYSCEAAREVAAVK